MTQHEQSPEEIRREIEQTRANLGETLHDIEDKVSPSKIKERRTAAVRGRWQRMRNAVMGAKEDTAQRVGGGGQQMTERAQEAKESVSQAVSQAPEQAMQQARGNPLAAGIIAFGGGLLVASMLPSTEREQEAASTLKDRYAEPVKRELQDIGQQAKEELGGSAQQAAQEIRLTAEEAAERTRDQAKGSTERVRDDAKSRKEAMQSS